MKLKPVKIIIRYFANLNSNTIINYCLLHDSRHTKQNTKRNRRKM